MADLPPTAPTPYRGFAIRPSGRAVSVCLNGDFQGRFVSLAAPAGAVADRPKRERSR